MNEGSQLIKEYINGYSDDIQSKLFKLRDIILEAEPDLSERISWQMPTFYLNGNVIHFAANKKHIGIYPGEQAIVKFEERLKPYKTSKGAIQIPYDEELDKELIQDIVKFNVLVNKNRD
ncbi:iron chaperone [Clostridium sp. Marseille-P299]|uniref:iron chaperone n=1 Tax=Clostridium sp. Marseille-P299 TaxID=1805477 RepID=UPI00082EE595|nr:DUF1801 domain-containing protein [Clostridium sp. Marseille-P299]